MDDLIAFMQARLAEDAKHWQRIWRAYRGDKRIWGGWDGWGAIGHLVSECVDPTRGGRETAAKRKRLELYIQATVDLGTLVAMEYRRTELTGEPFTRAVSEARSRAAALETAVRLDAYVYADHADYKEEWKLDV